MKQTLVQFLLVEKSYNFKQVDDKRLSKTRKRINSKSPSKRGPAPEGAMCEFFGAALPFTGGHPHHYAMPDFPDGMPEEEERSAESDPKVAKYLNDKQAQQKKDGQAEKKEPAEDEKSPKEDQQDNQGSDDEKEEGDDQDSEQSTDDPDRQGVIREVDQAHLVFKRKTDDGTFEELWVYNIGLGIKSELETRRSILAGTDIPVGQLKSKDGKQTFDLWTVGNVQMLKVKGLPN